MKGTTLFKKKYLVKDNETGWICLGKPIILTFDNKLIEMLYQLYSDNKEIGGLLICAPKFGQKEKKVCLVCKGKIGRFNNYICPECDVLYCENCARTLSELENMCWVCETPFDNSKPSKPFKKEKEEVKEKKEVEVEEGVPKKVGVEVKRKK